MSGINDAKLSEVEPIILGQFITGFPPSISAHMQSVLPAGGKEKSMIEVLELVRTAFALRDSGDAAAAGAMQSQRYGNRRDQTAKSNGNNIQCSECKKFGHYRRECPLYITKEKDSGNGRGELETSVPPPSSPST